MVKNDENSKRLDQQLYWQSHKRYAVPVIGEHCPKGLYPCLFRLHLATQHSSPHLLRLQGPNTIVHLFPLSSLEITETPLRAEQYNSLFNIIICMQNNYFNFDYLYIIYNNTINLQTCETYICTLYEE